MFVLTQNHNQTYYNPHTFKLCPMNHWESLSGWSIYLTKEVSLVVPEHSSQQNTRLSLQHLSCRRYQIPQYLKLTLCVYITKWITNAHESWCELNIGYMSHIRSKASVQTFHCIYFTSGITHQQNNSTDTSNFLSFLFLVFHSSALTPLLSKDGLWSNDLKTTTHFFTSHAYINCRMCGTRIIDRLGKFNSLHREMEKKGLTFC